MYGVACSQGACSQGACGECPTVGYISEHLPGSPLPPPHHVHIPPEVGGPLLTLSSELDTVERFDPTRNNWEAAASTITKRSSFPATVLDGKLYAMGGYDGSSQLDTVERFDPTNNSWEAVASMSTKRRWTLMAVL